MDSPTKDGMVWRPISSAPIRAFMPDNWYMPHSPYVLAWTGTRTVIASYHYTEKGKGKWHADGRVMTGLTHWMPLPENPQ